MHVPGRCQAGTRPATRGSDITSPAATRPSVTPVLWSLVSMQRALRALPCAL
jgi:hypothetical protein